MKKALIVGATGFGGLGLIEILLRHPHLKVQQLVARRDVGKRIHEVFPHLTGFCELPVQGNDEIDYANTDIAFFSTPDRAGMALISPFIERSIPVIDFSGDFRFTNTDDYAQYAINKGMERTHLAPETLKEAVYGLPELFADKLRGAKLVGNPGCFAICMILGLLPAIKEKLIDCETIICDGKTGVSGAGKNPGESNFYPQRYEDVNTYREGTHQHVVEVENALRSVGGTQKIFFVPQIVPLNRGILITAYGTAKKGITTQEAEEIYREFYKNAPFVLITSRSPHTTDVRGSNRCEIRVSVDARTNTFFVTSVIDNLVKGQAGNAVQCANLMLGFEETAGLLVPAFYP
ncbi:MAG: N-acetyl-gamma-glutamyl-phosphate reductase [Spirochaetes bacterium]|nr:N-acetyl-gamma-glutamyl-phosphate reductase [Spirochaetota bacterium]